MRLNLSSRWRRAGLSIVIAWLLLWGLGWLAGPALIRHQIERQGSAALGRTVSVQAVQLHPWSLSLRVQGLRVAGLQATDPPLFELDELFADLELASLWHRGPVIDALQVVRPRLHLTHLGDGRYDIDDLLERWQQPQDPNASALRFALFNIGLSDGAVTLDDQPRRLSHAIQGIQVQVPFLSNLPSRRDVVTRPHLAFELNGMRVESGAETTPFATDRETEARLNVRGLDIQPYLPYWPARLPLRPMSGVLDTDVSVHFAWHDQPEVTLRGQTSLRNLAVQSSNAPNASDQPELTWEELSVGIREFQPFRRRLALENVRLVGLQGRLERDAQGVINLQRWVGEPSGKDPAPEAASAPTWSVEIERFGLESGQLSWIDRTTKPHAQLNISQAAVQVEGFHWPAGEPATVSGSLRLEEGQVRWQGRAGMQAGEVNVELDGLPLRHARPYWLPHWTVEADGTAAAKGVLAWQPQDNGSAALTATIDEARLSRWRIGSPRRPDMQGTDIVLRQGRMDLTQQRVEIGRIELLRPDVLLSRGADGVWMVERWQPASAPAPSMTAHDSASWSLAIQAIQVEAARVRVRDELVGVALDVDRVKTTLGALRLPAARPEPIPVQLQARVALPGQEPGRLQYKGSLTLPESAGAVLASRGDLTADRLPLHALEPYLDAQLNFDLLHADASFRGPVSVRQDPTGLHLSVRGQAAIDDLRAVTRDPAEPLLDWHSLQLRGLEVDVEGGALRRLAVGETALSDYFARIIIDERGHINLQGLLKAADATANDQSTAEAADAPAAPPAVIAFGPVALVNGRVRFSDRFIQPNYNANLSELTGSLSAFDNAPARPDAPTALASVNLRGRVEGTATLDVNGQINPLARPVALDLRAEVRELELPPLSPYSSKYAGYGIERGKLSMDVNYRINPDGQLQAENQIILQQLRFGDRMEGSEAPNLPIKLAVALLTDRNGVIDINLPISGSINDPEFRLGPIIVRLIVNLIGKAITAPFALLSSAFADADDLQTVPFPAGQATLDAPLREKLNRIAEALIDRPGLSLTIVGHADLDSEREAWRRTVLRQRVEAEKRRQLLRDGAAPDAPVSVSDAEYPGLIREVYRRADIAKPRNLIGMAKELPLPEMEALLLASIPVDNEQMRELAVARALAIKDHLITRQVPVEQLFLGGEQIASDKPDNDAPRGQRAELTLSSR